jgi:hypothetical protein
MGSKCRKGDTMTESVLNTPILWINGYLKEKLGILLPDAPIPFFPSSPTALEDLYTMFPEGGLMCTYDRLIRMRRSPFPHIKTEQVLYYFYATATNTKENMVKIQESVLRLMDREDETAEEINNWAKGKNIGGFEPKFYFHRFKVYQLQETRDIVDFGTARTYTGNKIIIDFDYHQDTSISQ